MFHTLYPSDAVHASANPATDIVVSRRRTTNSSESNTTARSLKGVVTATATADATLTKTNITRLTTTASAPLRNTSDHASAVNSPPLMAAATARDSSTAAPMAAMTHWSGAERSMSPELLSLSGWTSRCTSTSRTTSSPMAMSVRVNPTGDRLSSPAWIMAPPTATAPAATHAAIRKGSAPTATLSAVTPTGSVDAIMA